MLRILGSSELLGSPTQLVDKLAVGVWELARDPVQGIQLGPEEFLRGIGTGLQGVVKGVVGGVFQAVSRVTGSLYSITKGLSGGEDARSEHAENICQGVCYGVKGAGSELYLGARGLFATPYEAY